MHVFSSRRAGKGAKQGARFVISNYSCELGKSSMIAVIFLPAHPESRTNIFALGLTF